MLYKSKLRYNNLRPDLWSAQSFRLGFFSTMFWELLDNQAVVAFFLQCIAERNNPGVTFLRRLVTGMFKMQSESIEFKEFN